MIIGSDLSTQVKRTSSQAESTPQTHWLMELAFARELILLTLLSCEPDSKPTQCADLPIHNVQVVFVVFQLIFFFAWKHVGLDLEHFNSALISLIAYLDQVVFIFSSKPVVGFVIMLIARIVMVVMLSIGFKLALLGKSWVCDLMGIIKLHQKFHSETLGVPSRSLKMKSLPLI